MKELIFPTTSTTRSCRVRLYIKRRIQSFLIIKSAQLFIQAMVVFTALLCYRAFRMPLLQLKLFATAQSSHMWYPHPPHWCHTIGFLLQQESNLKLMYLHSRHCRALHHIIYSPWFKTRSDLQPQSSWCVFLYGLNITQDLSASVYWLSSGGMNFLLHSELPHISILSTKL